MACVKDDSTANDQNIVLRTGSMTDGMKWKISVTSRGGYKITPKTGEANNRVLAVGWYAANVNGINIQQRDFVDDSNLKDEWELIDINSIYGSQTHRTLSSSQRLLINCHGYAMLRNDWPREVAYNEYGTWWYRTTEYTSNVTSIDDNVKHNVSVKTKADFEEWLNNLGYSWTYESGFSSNGENKVLQSNQYRVVMRTGINYFLGVLVCDYHFWYQTYDGTWSNKHGRGTEVHLPVGTTPFSQGTSGWSLEAIVNDTVYTYTDFYDGEIYSYIITVG